MPDEKTVVEILGNKKLLKERINAGYRYASTHLANGKTLDELESIIKCAEQFDDYGDFEIGIEEAIKDCEQLVKNGISRSM